MKRIDTTHADPNANGTGKAGFTDGNPGSVAPTEVGQKWLNGIQEETLNVIEAAGLTPSDAQNQLVTAIASLIASLETEPRAVQQIRNALGGPWTHFDTSTSVLGIAVADGYDASAASLAADKTHNPVVAVCGTNMLATGDIASGLLSSGSVTASLKAVAIRPQTSGLSWSQAVAVGLGGACFADNFSNDTKSLSGSATEIAGSPDLTEIIYDPTFGFVAAGAGGIVAIDNATFTLTRTTNVAYDYPVAIPGGYTLFVRASDNKIRYSSDHGVSFAGTGPTLSGTCLGAVYDSKLGMAVFLTDDQIAWTDGPTALVTIALPTGGSKRLISVGGRYVVVCTFAYGSDVVRVFYDGAKVWSPQKTLVLGSAIAGCSQCAVSENGSAGLYVSGRIL